MLRPIPHLLASLFLVVASFAAEAAKPSAKDQLPEPYRNKPTTGWETVWYCAYAGNALLRCQLGEAGARAKAPAAAINPSLPVVARQIIEAPEMLAGRVIDIPLLAPPFEFSLVGQLAESVMCGSRPGCGIIFGENAAQLAQLVQQYEAHRFARRAATQLASSVAGY
ncbi:MAG: hypothetical protein A3H93_03515 [Rhodocyclales bacterium RIFCSPLOWO2_02_FULL_63_24]|nr:MAG: hypothetical protein A2040_07995 [Rhodocyclales bacterium GWA2_65_19]OHC67950.1 MAG: hypothetical protein A3H93_03515 [Rhodocyclales bacterium RIFCSPLOWO2_02_FULL_63_24]